jgi:hypothetical protein
MFGGLFIAVLNNGPLRRELPHVMRGRMGLVVVLAVLIRKCGWTATRSWRPVVAQATEV